MTNANALFLERRRLIDDTLERLLPQASTPPTALHEAMRYSVFAGGKRLRPILCLAACEAVGGALDAALTPAAALEVFHTYTLIHDDLPFMDDDNFRRGKPTLHKVVGPAMAILAGDALLTLAFELLAQADAEAKVKNDWILTLARSGGSQGVVGGQCMDMAAEQTEPDRATLAYIHTHKTADLICASMEMGAAAGRATRHQRDALRSYGRKVGMAFQIVDDILDEIRTLQELGKDPGSDRKKDKMTSVKVHGLTASRNQARSLVQTAMDDLGETNSEMLQAIANFILQRDC